MHLALASLALVSAGLLAAAQEVTLPPSLGQCAEAALTLQGGVAPYTISVLPGAQLSGDPLEVLPVVMAPGTVNWFVDLVEGQRVTFRVEDAGGTVGYSSPVEILEGDTSDCIGANALSRSASLIPSSSLPLVSSSASSSAEPTSTSFADAATAVSTSTDLPLPPSTSVLPASVPSTFNRPEAATTTSTGTGGRGTVVVVRADSAASRGGKRSALCACGVVLAACFL